MAMTALLLPERLSHNGHVNFKGILPRTSIFEYSTYIVSMPKCWKKACGLAVSGGRYLHVKNSKVSDASSVTSCIRSFLKCYLDVCHRSRSHPKATTDNHFLLGRLEAPAANMHVVQGYQTLDAPK